MTREMTLTLDRSRLLGFRLVRPQAGDQAIGAKIGNGGKPSQVMGAKVGGSSKEECSVSGAIQLRRETA